MFTVSPNITGEVYVRILKAGSNIVQNKSGAYAWYPNSGTNWTGEILFENGDGSIKNDVLSFNASRVKSVYKGFINGVQPYSLMALTIVRT